MPGEEIFYGNGMSDPKVMIVIVGFLLGIGILGFIAYAIYKMIM